MEKFKVSFEANNQQLKSIGTKHASDTYADIEATFVLGEKWTDMDSVSAVWWNDFTRVATVLDSQGKCIVPHEVLARKGCVRVNLVGSIVEGDELVTRLTSYSAEAVQVNEKIKLTGNEPQSITPSQYEQFVQNVKADADRAEAGATASANSADEAEASAQNASESASASAVSASDSARSATASAGYAQNAKNSATDAETAKEGAESARDKILDMRATAETLEAGSDATASYSDGLLTLGIPRGDQGIQGIQGETGATPNLTIGTVETLEPTEDATASITGTAENPVLNLGLPKGDTGEVSLEDLGALLPTDTASGDIASITDGQNIVPVKSLKVTLEPIQDLHGYDKPWSGGAGKNKANVADISTSTNFYYVEFGTDYELTADQTYTFSADVTSNIEPFTLSVGSGTDTYAVDILSKQNNNNGRVFITFTPTSTQLETHKKLYVRVPRYITQQNITATIKNIQLEIGSTATSYEPYSNICPISGRTEVVTQRTGKNLLPKFSVSDFDNGTIYGLSTYIIIPIKAGTYTISNNAPTGYIWAGIDFNTGQSYTRVFAGNPKTITVSEDTDLMYGILTTDKATALSYDAQIELGSTATAYEPYNGTTYTTELEGNYTVVGTDNVPYLLKPVGEVDGDRLREKIVGGSVGWNQLGKEFTANNWQAESGVTVSFDNGVAEFASTVINNGIKTGGLGAQIIGGHKYLALVSVKSSSSASGQKLRIIASGQATPAFDIANITTSFSTVGGVASAESNQTLSVYIYPTSSSAFNATISLKDFLLTDLTLMFGSTIADYIYSLEQSTEGAGVAWFKEHFAPNDYYPYNSGELMSVQTSAHVAKDASDNVIGNYPLDSSLTLRGIPKLDASNNLYYDGDTYEADGTVTRKYGIVDLGTLTWSVLSDSPYGNFATTALNQLAKQDPTKPTYICNAYDEAAFNTASSTADKYIWLNNNKKLIVKDMSKASMTAATFKSAMSGVYLVYELATPTTETATPFEAVQKMASGGTLQYVTDSIVPVGHDTEYLSRVTYGGVLDVISGELVVDRAMVDLGSLNWQYQGQNCFFASLNGSLTNGNIISDRFVIATKSIGALREDLSIGLFGYYGNNTVSIKDTRYDDTTISAFVASLDGAQGCYELATPQTYQLTPQEIKLLLGTNNVWSDGNVTLVYSADIQRWVEKKLNGNSTTLTMSRPMTAELNETETE